MEIRKMQWEDYDKIIVLMSQMPDFFSPETVEYAQEKINELQWFVVYENDLLLWFIVFWNTTEDTTKIYRMGVKKDYQGKWIGTTLFQKCEQEAKKSRSKKIELLTLWDHVDYPWYANTRKFYEKMWCILQSSYMDHDIEICTLTKKVTE